MRLGLLSLAAVLCAGSAVAQDHQPPGVAEALREIASQPATHTAITFDRDMLQSASGFMGDGAGPVAGLNGITVENYRYREPAFYTPENYHQLVRAYNTAGWTHLVDQNAGAKLNAQPTKPLTDLWMHFSGMNIDAVTVVVRAPKQMSVIEVTGTLKPLDLVHLSGHFGIPKVDPSAVMVPAGPGK